MQLIPSLSWLLAQEKKPKEQKPGPGEYDRPWRSPPDSLVKMEQEQQSKKKQQQKMSLRRARWMTPRRRKRLKKKLLDQEEREKESTMLQEEQWKQFLERNATQLWGGGGEDGVFRAAAPVEEDGRVEELEQQPQTPEAEEAGFLRRLVRSATPTSGMRPPSVASSSTSEAGMMMVVSAVGRTQGQTSQWGVSSPGAPQEGKEIPIGGVSRTQGRPASASSGLSWHSSCETGGGAGTDSDTAIMQVEGTRSSQMCNGVTSMSYQASRSHSPGTATGPAFRSVDPSFFALFLSSSHPLVGLA